MTRYTIRISSFFAPFLLVIGVTTSTAYVTIDDTAIEVRYGFFRYRLPLAAISSVESMDWPLVYGIGLRIAPGLTLGCVASADGVARVNFAAPQKLSLLLRAIGVGCRAFAVSLDEPNAFMSDLRSRITRAA